MFNNFLLSKRLNNRQQAASSSNLTRRFLKTKVLLKRILPLSTSMLLFLLPIVSVKAQTPLVDRLGIGVVQDKTPLVDSSLVDRLGIGVIQNKTPLDDDFGLGGGSAIGNWSAPDLEILRLTNVERQKYGLPPLRLSKILSIAAMCHAKDLAENNNFYLQPGVDVHTGSDGSSILNRVTRAGYQPSYYGENVYYQYPTITAADAVNWWMNSPGHRANILNPNYTEIGIGYSLVNNGSIHRYVQDFGQLQPGSIPTENLYC